MPDICSKSLSSDWLFSTQCIAGEKCIVHIHTRNLHARGPTFGSCGVKCDRHSTRSIIWVECKGPHNMRITFWLTTFFNACPTISSTMVHNKVLCNKRCSSSSPACHLSDVWHILIIKMRRQLRVICVVEVRFGEILFKQAAWPSS